MSDQISNQIKELGDVVRENHSNVQEKLSQVSGKLDKKDFEALKAELDAGNETFKKQIADLGEANVEVAKKLDAFAQVQQKKAETGAQVFRKALASMDADEVKAKLKSGGLHFDDEKNTFGLKSNEIEAVKAFFSHMNRKAVGDMTIAGNTTGEVQRVEKDPTIKSIISRTEHMRDFMMQSAVGAEIFRFVKETGGEGGPTPVLEGATIPQVDYDYTAEDAPVTNIASFTRITDQMLQSVDGIAQHIETRGVKQHLLTEDAQILFGTGVSPQLEGLTINANTAANVTLSIATPNDYDCILAAIAVQAGLDRTVDRILQNPVDTIRQLSDKGSNGQYLTPITFVGGVPTIYGIPLTSNTAITEGNILVGDMAMGAELKFRTGVSIEYSNSDADNFTSYKQTIRIGQRLAMPIYYPDSFFYDSFADIKTALTT